MRKVALVTMHFCPTRLTDTLAKLTLYENAKQKKLVPTASSFLATKKGKALGIFAKRKI